MTFNDIDPYLNQFLKSLSLTPGNEAYKFLDSPGLPLRVDKVGEAWVLGWWADEPPTSRQKQWVSEVLANHGVDCWYWHWRPGSSKSKNPVLLASGPKEPADQWIFCENGVRYHGRRNQGHNYGLFLDQRQNRKSLGEMVQGKSVLNLFSFTCGFSLCAALGGASEVASVDLSQKYLDWGKDNFMANSLNPENYSFYGMNAEKYLVWALKKEKKFDHIICDPPSFSRSKTGFFRIEKDYGRLLSQCWQVLAPGGVLWFSTNYEGWPVKKWNQKVRELELGKVREVVPVVEKTVAVPPFQQRMKMFSFQKQS